jgi:hypothetical protein
MNIASTAVQKQVIQLPDEVLHHIAMAMPWQYDIDTHSHKDPDGFPSPLIRDKEDTQNIRNALQKTCWFKFHENPQVNTAVRGLVGRLAGAGFETSSGVRQIQEKIELVEKDHRNRLYNFWPKYVGRSLIEGELYLTLTVHTDGFIEVDFIDPSTVQDGGTDDTGIIFHPRKTLMPLFYNVRLENGDLDQIPSIYIARYPELISVASKNKDYDRSSQQMNRSRKRAYRPLRGYVRFIVSWEKGFITRRSVSYLRTILKWLNHYENLKNYEIDHKKSSGAYAWTFNFEDITAFRTWLSLSDIDRKKTAVMQPMTPGSRLFLPPGMSLTAVNPKLASISGQDTDIMQMMTSGLNEASDVTTGSPAGSYSSVRATRGPMSDRTSDEVAYFDRFLKYDFWSGVFFLMSTMSDFPETFEVEEAVDFKATERKVPNADGFDDTKYQTEPIFGKVKKKPEDLVDVAYPVSETIEYEGRARAFLGVKHGPIAETLGIPNEDIAKKLGAGNYKRLRLRKATEDKQYPDLTYNIDAESLQETVEGEPKKPVKKETKPK